MFSSNEIHELKTRASHTMSGDTLLHLITMFTALVIKTSSLYASDMFRSYMYGNTKYMFSAHTRRQLKYRYRKMVNTGKNCLF